MDVEPRPVGPAVAKKYSPGTMFFVCLVLATVSAVAGIGGTLLLQRVTRKKIDLPTMEFINPNYIS